MNNANSARPPKNSMLFQGALCSIRYRRRKTRLAFRRNRSMAGIQIAEKVLKADMVTCPGTEKQEAIRIIRRHALNASALPAIIYKPQISPLRFDDHWLPIRFRR